MTLLELAPAQHPHAHRMKMKHLDVQLQANSKVAIWSLLCFSPFGIIRDIGKPTHVYIGVVPILPLNKMKLKENFIRFLA